MLVRAVGHILLEYYTFVELNQGFTFFFFANLHKQKLPNLLILQILMTYFPMVFVSNI